MVPEASVDDLYYGYGVDGSTGAYLDEPMNAHDVAELALADIQAQGEEEARLVRRHTQLLRGSYGSAVGVDMRDLGQCGWGVIFARGVDQATKDALAPLLAHREAQAGDLFRVYDGDGAYVPGDSWESFCLRHRAMVVLAYPQKMPYYLLIVGDPETIPYRFQYQASVARAVGRISFPGVEDYARYAESVVQAERGELPKRLPRHASFIGTRNPEDRPTECSITGLVAPLAEALKNGFSEAGWGLDVLEPEQATKAGLGELLGGSRTPSLLFAATHGAAFHKDDGFHPRSQGALVTQDWPGPYEWRQRLKEDFLFTADDVGDSAELAGMIAVFLGSFCAGTPRADDFYLPGFYESWERVGFGDEAFVGRLPQRLLSHPNGGALAVVGHVERSWTPALKSTPGAHGSRDYEAFSTLFSLLSGGFPIGAAIEETNARYSHLAAALAIDLDPVLDQSRAYTDDVRERAAILWTASNDARNLIIIGDPAVRVPVAGAAAAVQKAPAAALLDRSEPIRSTAPVAVAETAASGPAPRRRQTAAAAAETDASSPAPRRRGTGAAAAEADVQEPAPVAASDAPRRRRTAAAAAETAVSAPAPVAVNEAPRRRGTASVDPETGLAAPRPGMARLDPIEAAKPVAGQEAGRRASAPAAARPEPTWGVPPAAPRAAGPGAARSVPAADAPLPHGAPDLAADRPMGAPAAAGPRADALWGAVPPTAQESASDPLTLWRGHIRSGYELNNALFRRVVDAFLGPYNTTLWTHRVGLVVGVLSLIAAFALTSWLREPLYALPFVALCALIYIGYFIIRPAKALEEDLERITWLSIVYNSYWRRTIVSDNPEEAQIELQAATQDAIAYLERLMARHGRSHKGRFGMED